MVVRRASELTQSPCWTLSSSTWSARADGVIVEGPACRGREFLAVILCRAEQESTTGGFLRLSPGSRVEVGMM